MKTHTKKKEYRKMMKKLANEGYAPLPNGNMVKRSQLVDNSMKRDFHPQQLG